MNIDQIDQLKYYLGSSLSEAKVSKELNITTCLTSSAIFDFDNQLIQSKINQLKIDGSDPWGKTKQIFDFVRDNIVYDFAPDIIGLSSWYASVILKKGSGFCHQKAIVLTAMLRGAEIPTCLVFQNVKDHILFNTRFKDLIPGGMLPLHALVAVNISNKWYRLDSTLDSNLCNKKGYHVSQIEIGKETLLPTHTLDGHQHFSIEKELGYFEIYPETFRALLLENIDDWKAWGKIVNKKRITM
jgi:hypothetical protein